MRPLAAITVGYIWLLFGAPGGPQPADLRAVVDLGHPLSESDPSWTGERVFTHTPSGSAENGGIFSGRFSSDEHFGTHLDAPAHFAHGRWTVDRIPVERLVRPGVRLNVAPQVARDDDYRVTLEDLRALERRHGRISEGAVVLIATGWDARWGDPARYRNERDGVKHFPGLSVEAATYLARDRRVAGIAIDTLSVDYGPSTTFEAHRATQLHDVYHVENAAKLTDLPPRGFTVIVAPIDIAGGSGGPTRLFALLR